MPTTEALGSGTMSGVHPYWLVYLHWIGAVPAIVFLGCLLLRAVARLTAPAA